MTITFFPFSYSVRSGARRGITEQTMVMMALVACLLPFSLIAQILSLTWPTGAPVTPILANSLTALLLVAIWQGASWIKQRAWFQRVNPPPPQQLTATEISELIESGRPEVRQAQGYLKVNLSTEAVDWAKLNTERYWLTVLQDEYLLRTLALLSPVWIVPTAVLVAVDHWLWVFVR